LVQQIQFMEGQLQLFGDTYQQAVGALRDREEGDALRSEASEDTHLGEAVKVTKSSFSAFNTPQSKYQSCEQII